MKVLNLLIKQKYFDAIMQGHEVQEFREIRPTTAAKLVEMDEEGFFIEDKNGNSVPVKYDAIRFFVGYNKDRDSALVEVESAYTEIFTQPMTYEDGTPMLFEADKNGNLLYFATDAEDNLITDANGNYVPTDNKENGLPLPIRDGRKGATVEMPITYEYKGDTWVAEQVVYNLGKIIEKSVKNKIRK